MTQSGHYAMMRLPPPARRSQQAVHPLICSYIEKTCYGFTLSWIGASDDPYSMPLKEAALVQNLKMLLGVEAVALPIFVRHYSCPARF
jgi:hypothetical protein